MAELVAYKSLNTLLRLRPVIAEQHGRFFLQLVAQGVLIAVALEMHDRPDAEQEIFRFVQPGSDVSALATTTSRFGGSRLLGTDNRDQ